MGKLLRNDFNTLFKSKIIFGGILILLLFLLIEGSNVLYANEVLEEVEKHGVSSGVKALVELITFRSILIYFLMFLPSFIIGYDFDGGMIRNKIMAGFSRVKIYFSALITSYVVALFYGLVLIVYEGISFAYELTPAVLLDWMSQPESTKILVAGIVFDLFIKFALCAVAVSLMMMINHKTISIVAFFVVLLIGLLFGEIMRAYARDENQYNQYYDTETKQVVTVENPMYIAPDDPMKKVFIAIDGMNIFFSASAEYGMEVEGDCFTNDAAYYLGGIVDIVVFTATGIYVFNKRNLK